MSSAHEKPECEGPCAESHRLYLQEPEKGHSYVGSHAANVMRNAYDKRSARLCKPDTHGKCRPNGATAFLVAKDSLPTYDGTDNNLEHPEQGAACTALARRAPVAYADGISTLAERTGPGTPNPRVVSNAVCFQDSSRLNEARLSDLFWSWGQFIDHEIDLTEAACPPEDASFVTPEDDPVQAGATVPFKRSVFVKSTGTLEDNPRQQLTQISAYLDGTNVYGSSYARARELRRLDGTGKLRTYIAPNGEEFPIQNRDGWANANGGTLPNDELCLCGDVRANENVLLLSLHTLYVREHNRVCDVLATKDCFKLAGSEELIYQHARRYVTALIQHITFDAFLPHLLGAENIPPYAGYRPDVDATIDNEFSTVAYRVGHTMVSEDLRTVDAEGTEGSVPLTDAFFAPNLLTDTVGALDAFVRGAATQVMQELDVLIVSALRSFLFGPPTATMLVDLAALNIQRARDHGIPDYNTVREAYGLARRASFAEITSDVGLATALSDVYGGDIDAVDPWIGGLAEGTVLADRVAGSQLGELFYTIILGQFVRLRDGDRFWWERTDSHTGLNAEQRDEIRATTLRDVVLRNTGITADQLPDQPDLFLVPEVI